MNQILYNTVTIVLQPGEGAQGGRPPYPDILFVVYLYGCWIRKSLNSKNKTQGDTE